MEKTRQSPSWTTDSKPNRESYWSRIQHVRVRTYVQATNCFYHHIIKLANGTYQAASLMNSEPKCPFHPRECMQSPLYWMIYTLLPTRECMHVCYSRHGQISLYVNLPSCMQLPIRELLIILSKINNNIWYTMILGVNLPSLNFCPHAMPDDLLKISLHP